MTGLLEPGAAGRRPDLVVQQAGEIPRWLADRPGRCDDAPLGRRERQRGSQVIGEQGLGQPGQASVPGLADGERAPAEQAPAYLRQPQPDVVVPAHVPRAAAQRQHPLRDRREHAWPAHLREQGVHVGPAKTDPGVEVQAREPGRGVIGGPQGTVPGNRAEGKHAHAGPEGCGNLGRVVRAAVRGNDDLEVACGCERRELAEQATNNLAFVMRGNHNSDHDKTV